MTPHLHGGHKPKQLKKREPPVGGSEHLRGGSPESAVDLFEKLKKARVGKLGRLKFAVLGLGDSSEFFCQTGRISMVSLASGARRIQAKTAHDVDRDAAKA